MKSSTQVTRAFQGAAIALLVAGIGIWAATGARIGWTQTSLVEIQRDEITGIDYPVRHPAFIAGVEIPLLGAAIAAAIAGVGAIKRRAAGRRA